MTVTKRDLLILALMLAGAFFLRFVELDAYRLNVDVGAHFLSAKIDELPRGGTLGDWLRQDAAWLVSEKTFPHCFLHQLDMRWLHRLGASAPYASAASSAFFGALTVLAVFLLHRLAAPRRPAAALVSSALVAVATLPVFYSRVVWGEMAATFFWVLYLAVMWIVFERARADDHGRMLRLGLLAAALLLVGFGYQEFLVVYATAMGSYALLSPWLARGAERKRERGFLSSARTWTWALSGAPLVLLSVAALLYSDELVRMQFGVSVEESYWPYRLRVLQLLFLIHQVHVQIGAPIVALACVGAIVLWLRDRRWALFLLANFAASCVLFVLLFRDSHLVRLYLPCAVIAMVLAGEGVAAAMRAVAGEGAALARRVAAFALPVALVAYLALQTWQTLFGAPTEPFFNARFHGPAAPRVAQSTWAGLPAATFFRLPGLPFPDLPPAADLRPQAEQDAELVVARDVEAPLIEALARVRAPDEVVKVTNDFTALFYLRDAGIPTAPVNLGETPRESWPRLLVAVKRLVPTQGLLAADGGPYEELAADRLARLALYRRIDR